MVASATLVISCIFALVTAHPGTGRVVFVTRITSDAPPHRPSVLLEDFPHGCRNNSGSFERSRWNCCTNTGEGV
jgi:hypothetical protein